MQVTYTPIQLSLLQELYDSCLEYQDDGSKYWNDNGLNFGLVGLNQVTVTIDDEGVATATMVCENGAIMQIDPSFKNVRKLVVNPDW